MTCINETDIVLIMRLNKLSFKVFKIINEYNLIKPEDSIIIGVSGGPDSVALLKILHSINLKKGLRLRLFIAHLNHRLRGRSSEEDAQFVRNLSKNFSLPFILKTLDIQKAAGQTKGSIEEIGRRERYKFFMESAQEHNASLVAVGHTADDNGETILHRIIRGTGILGLGGIPIKRPLKKDSSIQLVRPLLFTPKKEIIEYLERENLNYRTDISNYEPIYLRNKIRLELIPLLENQYNPNIKRALMQLCQILTINNEYVSLEAKKILKESTVESNGNSYSINTRFLIQQPKILQYRILQEILHIMQVPLKEITFHHYTMIIEEISRTGKGKHLQLPGKFHLWHEHGILHLRKEPLHKICMPLPSEVIIQIPGITPVNPLGRLVSEILDVQEIPLELYRKTKTKDEEIFDLESITMPVAIRSRKNGDTISPLGIQGHKKLKDLFIDKKVPLKERDSTPIVVMNNRPIWVIGICIDNKVKITPHTKKILKLTFQKVPV